MFIGWSYLRLKKLPHTRFISSINSLAYAGCRLNREIAATQKLRRREYDPVLVKDVEQVAAIDMERLYSDPAGRFQTRQTFRSAVSAPDSHRHIYG